MAAVKEVTSLTRLVTALLNSSLLKASRILSAIENRASSLRLKASTSAAWKLAPRPLNIPCGVRAS